MDESETLTASQGNNLLSGEIKKISIGLPRIYVRCGLIILAFHNNI